MKKLPLLRVLTKKDLHEISNNFKLTKHASVRLKERYDPNDTGDIEEAIREADFAYVAGDGVINVGLVDGTIFKFAQDTRKYIMITYLEASMNGKNIRYKYSRACRGGNR